jgi:hypothetical protein
VVTWTKLSDDYTDDCWTLSDGAFRLHTELHVWSNRKLLDCRVPIADLARASRCPEFLPELVEKGYASCDGETVTIRHHAIYQRTREQQIGIQERNQENGAKGGRPPKPGRERHNLETQMGTQMETQMGSAETQMGTQLETQRDGTGQDRRSEQNNAGTSASDDEAGMHVRGCEECQRRYAFAQPPCPIHISGSAA